jgi:hypothetical protein
MAQLVSSLTGKPQEVSLLRILFFRMADPGYRSSTSIITTAAPPLSLPKRRARSTAHSTSRSDMDPLSFLLSLKTSLSILLAPAV